MTLGIALTVRFGLYGLYASVFLALLTVLAFMYARQPLRGNFRGRFRDRFETHAASFRSLLIPSLILMGLGLGNIAIHNVDRVVILWARGAGAELGCYQVAATLSLMVSQIPCILLTVLVPRLFRFGREHCRQLRPYLLLPTAVIAVLSIAVGSIGYIVLPAMLGWFLPKYTLAAMPASILMLGEACFAIAMVPETLIVTLDRGLQSLAVRILVIVGGTAGSWWGLSHAHGLSGVAASMCAAQAAGSLVLGVMAARTLHVSTLHFLGAAFGPVLYALAALLGISAVVPSSWGAPQAVLVKLALCSVALAPLAALPVWFAGIRLPGRLRGINRVVGRVVRHFDQSEVV